MFNKEGIPFFTVIIPFFSILFISFFSISYYLKVSNKNFEVELREYKKVYFLKENISKTTLDKLIEDKIKRHKQEQESFKSFMLILIVCVLIFMAVFSYLMMNIINDVVRKYKQQVKNEEQKLQTLNKTLAQKVREGIEEAKRKDKAILQQSKLARMGSMISMIAHQWRQPLTQLSGILMELETATTFKKVDEKHILRSISKSDKMIEYMSNTIDDFRNFYKPDKKKEDFFALDSCKKAINLASASLKDSSIELDLDIRDDKLINGYPREYAQVILNLIINARDVLVEKRVKNPKINIVIDIEKNSSVVAVRDNAGGIKDEHFDLIFDPYFSTKDSSKGTGLGLYISNLIIEKNMRGELSVQNDKKGAVFTVKVGLKDE